MPTPFSYTGQYDPFNQRVRGQQPGYPQQTLSQPVQSGAYPQTSQPTGAYTGAAPSAPVYQGPPVQTQQPPAQTPPAQPPAYSTQGGQSPTGGWYQAPPVQSNGYYGQQTQPPVYSQQGKQAPAPQPTGEPQGQPTSPWWEHQQGPDWPQPLPGGGYGYPGTQTPSPAPAARQPAAYAMPGWDQGKWADPQKHDAKYDAGRLMSTLAPSVQNIPQVLAMLQQGGHQVQYGGGDTAVIDGYTVDLVQGSHSGSPQWQWLVPQSAPSPEQGQAGAMDPYTAMFLQQMQQMMGGGPGFQGPPQQTQAPASDPNQTALLQAIMQLLQNQTASRGPVAPNFAFY